MFNEAKEMNKELVEKYGYTKLEGHIEHYPIANLKSDKSVQRVDFQIR